MNFQYTPSLTPLRVLVINPLVPASQLTITKMLSGIVFGMYQLIDLILLVYSNEINEAQEYAQELTSCALPCFNSIRATSDLPNISDADIFCFMTNFANPNSLDFENMDSDEQFDTLYLIIKIAISLGKPLPIIEESKPKNVKKKTYKPEKEIKQPLIIGDGLLVIDILMSLAKTLPPEIFFCATPLRSISKTVLSDHLKVGCNDINRAYVWGANDQVFHVEIEKPYLVYDKVTKESSCDWDAIGKELLDSLSLDHIQFNAAWMKREFIEKVLAFSSSNPYGCIYKSAEFAKTLRAIWACKSHSSEVQDMYISLGVISDGSLGTIKGLPYVLPLIISTHSWRVNTCFEETSHVRNEIKRINKAAKEHHDKLIPYCKKFLVQNVIMKALIPEAQDSESESSDFSTLNGDNKNSIFYN